MWIFHPYEVKKHLKTLNYDEGRSQHNGLNLEQFRGSQNRKELNHPFVSSSNTLEIIWMQNKHWAKNPNSHIYTQYRLIRMNADWTAAREARWRWDLECHIYNTLVEKSNLISWLKRFRWKLIRVLCKFHPLFLSFISTRQKAAKSVFDWYSNRKMDEFEGNSEINVFVSIKTYVDGWDGPAGAPCLGKFHLEAFLSQNSSQTSSPPRTSTGLSNHNRTNPLFDGILSGTIFFGSKPFPMMCKKGWEARKMILRNPAIPARSWWKFATCKNFNLFTSCTTDR